MTQQATQGDSHVTNYIHLVFSDPPATVSDDDYNALYDAITFKLFRDGARLAPRG